MYVFASAGAYGAAPSGFSFFGSPVSSARKVLHVALEAIGSAVSHVIDQMSEAGSQIRINSFSELISEFMNEHNLSFRTMRYGFYGIRVPYIYLEYFVHEAVHDTIPAVIGNVLYLLAELGNLAKWLHVIEKIDLSQLSQALGKFKVLGKLADCPIDASLSIIGGLASAFYSVDYLIKLSKGTLSRQEKMAVWIGLSSCVIHIVAISVFFAVGPCTGLTVLTAFSSAFYMIYWALHRYPIKALNG